MRPPSEVVDAVEDWTPNGEEPYGKAYFPLSLGLVLPVIGAGLAFRAVSKRSPAKVVNRTMYVTLFGTLLNAQLLFVFLPTVVGIGIAAFQVRKAELRRGRRGRGCRRTSRLDGADDDIIEVEEAIDEEEAHRERPAHRGRGRSPTTSTTISARSERSRRGSAPSPRWARDRVAQRRDRTPARRGVAGSAPPRRPRPG